MSYDLELFLAPQGVDPGDFVAEAHESDAPFELAPSLEKERLLEALLAQAADLEVVRSDDMIELNASIDSGAQIGLFEHMASLSLPYWHEGEAAHAVWTESWQYLVVLRAQGLHVYDPQLDKLLDLDVDMPDVIACYEETVRQVSNL